MASNKYERFCSEMKRAAEWLHEHGDIGRESNKSVCIFICDRDSETSTIAFTGDVDAMIHMQEIVQDMIEETIMKIIVEKAEAGKWQ